VSVIVRVGNQRPSSSAQRSPAGRTINADGCPHPLPNGDNGGSTGERSLLLVGATVRGDDRCCSATSLAGGPVMVRAPRLSRVLMVLAGLGWCLAIGLLVFLDAVSLLRSGAAPAIEKPRERIVSELRCPDPAPEHAPQVSPASEPAPQVTPAKAP